MNDNPPRQQRRQQFLDQAGAAFDLMFQEQRADDLVTFDQREQHARERGQQLIAAAATAAAATPATAAKGSADGGGDDGGQRAVRLAGGRRPTEMAVLPSTPGVGIVIALTILLEIDTVERFDSRQQFCSYARLCGARQESAGKTVGTGNAKQGNAWLKWSFSEATVLSAQKDQRMGTYLDKLASRMGKAKALSALAHKLGRAFYHMLNNKEVFNID